MKGQRVRLKKEILHTFRTLKRYNRLGTITGETVKKTGWHVKWDGNTRSVVVKKNLLFIESNVADIVNDILIHKLKQ